MTAAIETLLVLNAGSSSLKFQVFTREGLERLAKGAVTRIGGAAELKAGVEGGPPVTRALAEGTDHAGALTAVLDFIDAHDDGWRTVAVVHRIVHGGTAYTAPVLMTPKVMEDLAALIPLAPLHQPHNLAAVTASERLVGDVPDVLCFDTAFHAGRDRLHTRLAIPGDLDAAGVRRYGFHGLSYAWLARVMEREHPALFRGRVVAAHLGNGASLCGMKAGRSVDTTMGMTALDGVPMGTRSGALDPGAVLYLQQAMGLGAAEVEALLYERSGLLGLSGISNDVATLMADGSEGARFALSYFAHRCAQAAAQMAVSIGGIDAMVFTGGIGEHAAPVREAILKGMAPLGRFEVLVIPADEERMMAMEAREVLRLA